MGARAEGNAHLTAMQTVNSQIKSREVVGTSNKQSHVRFTLNRIDIAMCKDRRQPCSE